ncbi:MAG: hypothetical protein OXE94_05820 [Aestuariivita sp.]|nr:hypothetical protein [Aestuariivita sp.]MCY4203651.1 hypothetical protein [Aestuariivita sp.]
MSVDYCGCGDVQQWTISAILRAKVVPNIVGARLQNFPKSVKQRILEVSRYRNVTGENIKVGVFRHTEHRIVVSYSLKRDRKEAHD